MAGSGGDSRAAADADRLYRAVELALDGIDPAVAFMVLERIRGELPAMQRRIADRLLSEGLSWEAIASLIGQSRTAVYMRLKGREAREE